MNAITETEILIMTETIEIESLIMSEIDTSQDVLDMMIGATIRILILIGRNTVLIDYDRDLIWIIQASNRKTVKNEMVEDKKNKATAS